MKKMLYAISVISVVFAANVQAQNIRGGIKAGMNLSDWGGDAKQSFSDVLELGNFAETQMLTGFHIGGYLSIPLGSNFEIEPALLYSTKGMRISQTLAGNNLLNVKMQITNHSHYLDLPVMAKYYITKGFHVYGGPQVSYLIDNKLEAEAGIFGFSVGEKFDIDRGFRKFDFAVAAGAGYRFPNGVSLGAGYDYGLSTLDKGSGDLDVYNRVIKFSIGYTF